MKQETAVNQLALDPDEVWRDVPGYEEFYEASNRGRVRTKMRRLRGYPAGSLLKQSPVPDGYLTVTLIRDGSQKKLYAHQVVMLAFVGPANGLDVNHKNGVKTDNRLENLEYSTRTENIYHARDVLQVGFGTRGEAHHAVKLTEQQVRIIRRRCAEGESSADLGREYGVTSSNISAIRTRRSWKFLTD